MIMKIQKNLMWIILTVLICAISGCAGAANGELMPYLQAATVNSVYVLAESVKDGPMDVTYGTNTLDQTVHSTQSVLTTADPPTYVHRIRLEGLSPHTVYRYRVAQNGKKSALHQFITAAMPGTAFRFAWMADCRTGITFHNTIAGRIKAAKPAFSLYGGDLCASPTYTSWEREYFTANERALIAEVPFFLAAGNHEGWQPNTQAFTQAPESTSGTEAYFSFNYGDVHFLAINNELSIKPGSPQYQFIKADLAATKQTWTIVFAHHPAYCVGGHGEDPDMIVLSENVFKPVGVDLVIAGHSHFYQHNEVNGIPHLVIGSAGAPLATPGTADYTLKSVKTYNYAIVDVTRHKLHLVVYDDKGEALDTVNLSK